MQPEISSIHSHRNFNLHSRPLRPRKTSASTTLTNLWNTIILVIRRSITLRSWAMKSQQIRSSQRYYPSQTITIVIRLSWRQVMRWFPTRARSLQPTSIRAKTIGCLQEREAEKETFPLSMELPYLRSKHSRIPSSNKSSASRLSSKINERINTHKVFQTFRLILIRSSFTFSH